MISTVALLDRYVPDGRGRRRSPHAARQPRGSARGAIGRLSGLARGARTRRLVPLRRLGSPPCHVRVLAPVFDFDADLAVLRTEPAAGPQPAPFPPASRGSGGSP